MKTYRCNRGQSLPGSYPKSFLVNHFVLVNGQSDTIGTGRYWYQRGTSEEFRRSGRPKPPRQGSFYTFRRLPRQTRKIVSAALSLHERTTSPSVEAWKRMWWLYLVP